MAWVNKFAAWLLTKNGRKFTYYTAGAVSTGVLCANILPQTIFLDQYKNVVHLYRKGFTASLKPILVDRFLKALDLAEVDEVDKILFKPFPYCGFNIFSAGTTYSKYGVIVGLPVYFAYEKESDVDKTGLKLGDLSILWETEEGEMLLKSCILSENAQLYAMAHEIKLRETPKIIIDTISSTLLTAATYGISSGINEKYNLYARPLVVRLILYFLVCSFTFGNYIFIKDTSQVYYEEKIDKELKAKSPIFAKGGLEFHSKMMLRNIALRQMLGKAGERKFTSEGNEIYWFRNRHLPTEKRRLFFQQKEESQLSA